MAVLFLQRGGRMSYGKRRYYKKRRGRSSNGFGGMVNDTAAIANKLGPKGALITGILGFLSFYFAFPWILVAWSDHNRAKMTGQLAPMMGKLLDDVFLRRFIHPLEWAGMRYSSYASVFPVGRRLHVLTSTTRWSAMQRGSQK